jgi:hypothetical protein
VAVAYADGREGHLLAFAGAVPGAEQGLAGIVGEALTFSGVAAGEIDVAFLRRLRSGPGPDREGGPALRPSAAGVRRRA